MQDIKLSIDNNYVLLNIYIRMYNKKVLSLVRLLVFDALQNNSIFICIT